MGMACSRVGSAVVSTIKSRGGQGCGMDGSVGDLLVMSVFIKMVKQVLSNFENVQ